MEGGLCGLCGLCDVEAARRVEKVVLMMASE
jgi:hypothetical protein